jgi:hypothetical protein
LTIILKKYNIFLGEKKMDSNKKKVRLKNKYSQEIVFCDDYNDINREVARDMDFIRVYTEKDPRRTYLANRQAFDILPD